MVYIYNALLEFLFVILSQNIDFSLFKSFIYDKK